MTAKGISINRGNLRIVERRIAIHTILYGKRNFCESEFRTLYMNKYSSKHILKDTIINDII